MKKLWLFLFVFLLMQAGASIAEEFSFKYREGEQYRIMSTVKEDVLINGVYSHTAEILNKISIEVAKVEEGSGYLNADFQTSERSAGSGGVYSWGQQYYSRFWRDELGIYDIEDHYYMPVVRNVPRFPKKNLEPGETWSGEGHEVHDFRTNFGIQEPYRFPITVHYHYLGKETREGEEYDLISIEYNVYYRADRDYHGSFPYPARLTGVSEQLLYWDNILGQPEYYSEQFEFLLILSNGATVEYRGTAEAQVIRSLAMDRKKIAEEIAETLKKDNIDDANVKIDEKGVTITLENIQFLPDSAVLIEREQSKLAVIAGILSSFPERDILITGHTALAGTEEGRQKLSELRAKTVGEYLLYLGAKEPEQITVRGMGARVPLADNSTEAGKKKNRRVEITILEN